MTLLQLKYIVTIAETGTISEAAKRLYITQPSLTSDRATLFNLLIGLNGYTICSGVINEKLNGENIVAVPLT